MLSLFAIADVNDARFSGNAPYHRPRLSTSTSGSSDKISVAAILFLPLSIPPYFYPLSSRKILFFKEEEKNRKETKGRFRAINYRDRTRGRKYPITECYTRREGERRKKSGVHLVARLRGARINSSFRRGQPAGRLGFKVWRFSALFRIDGSKCRLERAVEQRERGGGYRRTHSISLRMSVYPSMFAEPLSPRKKRESFLRTYINIRCAAAEYAGNSMKRRIDRPAKTERHRVTLIQLSSHESLDRRTENEAWREGRNRAARRRRTKARKTDERK